MRSRRLPAACALGLALVSGVLPGEGRALAAAGPEVTMSVTKSATPNPYTPGQPLAFTVAVHNGGPFDAVGATVSDPLPPELAGAGFTWTCTATALSSCTPAGSGPINDTVTVRTDGTLTYTITGTVPASVDVPLVNRATVTPPPANSDPICTPSCSSQVIVNPVSTVAMSVSKTAAPSPYVPGERLTYTITVANAGPSDAVGATVTDPLPAELASAGFTWTCRASGSSACTPSGAGGVADTVTIAAGGRVIYTVTGTVPPGTRGTLANTATATPPSSDVDGACTPSCSAVNRDSAAPAPRPRPHPGPPFVAVTG